jgi:hypothetical protein
MNRPFGQVVGQDEFDHHLGQERGGLNGRTRRPFQFNYLPCRRQVFALRPDAAF